VTTYDDLGLDDWRVDAQLIAASDGYTNQSVMLWGPGGEGITRMVFAVVIRGDGGIRLDQAQQFIDLGAGATS
jgi:hypothetical protein